VPPRLQPLLSDLGFVPGTYLKPYLDYFDTMNLIMATALAKGLTWRILEQYQATSIHIGGSGGQQLLGEHRLATYIGRQLLHRYGEATLRERYSHLYSAGRGAPESWVGNSAIQGQKDFEPLLAHADRILLRMDARLNELGRP
jgi:hypothetical protein